MTEFVTPGLGHTDSGIGHIDRMFASEAARSFARGLEQAADELSREEGQPDVWARLQQLQKLQQELDDLRRQHNDLVFALRDFARTLGVLHVETTDEMMRNADGA